MYGMGLLCMRSGCKIVNSIRMVEAVDNYMNEWAFYLLEALNFLRSELGIIPLVASFLRLSASRGKNSQCWKQFTLQWNNNSRARYADFVRPTYLVSRKVPVFLPTIHQSKPSYHSPADSRNVHTHTHTALR